MYLDFKKAFDKVPHNRLLLKLKNIGISGKVHNWIKSWLTNRKQRVIINNHASSWADVTSGVPQGSVLGPILFLIFINDIDCGITSYISKFADDTKLMTPSNSITNCDILQTDLNKMAIWARNWLMEYNVDKCKVLHIGKNNPQFEYSLNDTKIVTSTNETDLGVIMTSDLKSEAHISKVTKMGNKLVGLIGRSFEVKSRDVIIRLYKTLVRPHLEYCVQVWSPHFVKDIDKLERIQRRVTRLIPGIRHLIYEERLKELNLHSLKRRRTRADIIEIYKIIHCIDNVDINRHLSFSTNSTRGNSLKLNKKHASTDVRKHSFYNRIVGMWNSLPNKIATINSLPVFKRELDKYMDDHNITAFYN